MTHNCVYCGKPDPAGMCATCYQTPTPARDPEATVTGKVIGFRSWSLDGYRLKSYNTAAGSFWDIGVNEAECRRDQYAGSLTGHEGVPGHDCHCGLYAWHDVERAASMNSYGLFGDQDPLVFGAVTAWGRMEVHRSGFRAQYAQPVVLAYKPERPYRHVKDLLAIAGEMGVPCVEVDELAGEAARFGAPVPVEQRPAPEPVRELDAGTYACGGFVPSFSQLGATNYRWSSGSMQIPKSVYDRYVQIMSTPSAFYSTPPTTKEIEKAKGIKETLGYPGPPLHGRYKKGDRVKDRGGDTYRCVKGGRPGRWEREA